MPTSTKILVLIAVFLAEALSVSAKMHIWVYSGLYLGANRWSMKFSTPQKCYTFNSCFSDNTVGAEWDDIDYQAIVFYEKEQCQGTKLVSHTLPKGQLMFPSVKGAKSFMVWSDGMYATKDMNCITVFIFMCGLLVGVVRGVVRGGPIYGLPFNGELILYDGAYYDKRFATINFKRSSRCYQFNCSNLDNRVGSARWSGLPTRGGFQNRVNISFYANANCEGYQESFVLPHNGGVREFISKKVIGSISSFLVKQDSPKAFSYESVCNGYHDVNASVHVTAS